jgi:hypothetical protein
MRSDGSPIAAHTLKPPVFKLLRDKLSAYVGAQQL